MAAQGIVYSVMSVVGILISTIALATPPSTEDVTITRDAWLNRLKGIAPEMVCHGFTHNKDVNEKLVKAKINFEQCVAFIPAIFEGCRVKYYSVIPAVLKNDSIAQWGSVLGNCIGADFATAHFIPKNPSNITSKEVWLSQFSLVAPALMCAELFKNPSTREKLNLHHINNDKCMMLLPVSIGKCQLELLPTIPETLNEIGRKKWGDSLGNCVGKDFRDQHLN